MNILITAFTICLLAFHAFGQSDQQLVDRYDKAIVSQNYTSALRTAKSITERYPGSATWQFNLGSMQARTSDFESAITSLNKSAELGYTGVRSFEQSEDLEPLRDLEEFKEILKLVQTNAQARLDEFIAEANKHTPKVHIPESAPEKPALILALHGTGMRGADMIKSLESVADELGMVLVAPDALRPAGAGGFSWTYRDESEWIVDAMITQAAEKYAVDLEQVYLIGFSQGANIALTMGQAHPELFAGIIPICGHYEPHIASPDLESTMPPFYLMTGSRDPWKQTYVTAKRDFAAIKAPVQLRLLAGKGHEIPSGIRGVQELVRAIRWCEKQNED